MKKVIAGCALAAGVVLAAGGTAFAGEYNGKGEPIPATQHARSACAFSGQDIPDDVENNPPGFDDDAIMIHGVQTYGQFVAAGLKGAVPSPGIACRGNAEFEG